MLYGHVNRMFEAVANDFAIEDVLYQLDRALSENKMDLATYSKVDVSSESLDNSRLIVC